MRWHIKKIIILAILFFFEFNFLGRFKEYDLSNKLFVLAFSLSILLFIFSQFQNQTYSKEGVGIYMKRKWYLQTWFICVLFVFWPLIVPAILGVVFLILQIFENNKLGKKYGTIDSLDNKISDLETKIDEIEKSNSDLITNWNYKINNRKMEYDSLCDEIATLKQEAVCSQYVYSDYDGLTSEECKNKLALLKTEEQVYIKNSAAVKLFGDSPKRELNSNVKQILRCFNSECDNVLLNLSVKTIDTARNKITKSFETLNK